MPMDLTRKPVIIQSPLTRFQPISGENLELQAVRLEETAQPERDRDPEDNKTEVRWLQTEHEHDVPGRCKAGPDGPANADDGALAHLGEVFRLVFADVLVYCNR